MNKTHMSNVAKIGSKEDLVESRAGSRWKHYDEYTKSYDQDFRKIGLRK
jgi:hypothetical protein